MKKFILILLISLMLPSYAFAEEQTLIGGQIASPGSFPELIYISSGRARCSASKIGKSTIITAGHCISNGGGIGPVAEFVIDQQVFKAKCTHHPDYANEYSFDFALCKTNQEMQGPFASISKKKPKVGEQTTLMGFGCTQPRKPDGSQDPGGNDGKLRWGTANITQVDNGTNGVGGGQYYFTDDTTSLCFGDSGGPSMEYISDPTQDKHLISGINSRGDIRTRSLLSGVYNSGFQTWAKAYARANSVEICGINKDCFKSEPPKPDPREDECIEERYKVWKYGKLLKNWQNKLEECNEMQDGIILL